MTTVSVALRSLYLSPLKLWLQNVLFAFTNQLVQALAAFLVNSVSKIAPLQRIPLSLPSGVVRIRFNQVTKSQQLAITATGENIGAQDLMMENRVQEQVDNNTAMEMLERCVECKVLYEPDQEPFADVIFVHGLHGGLDRTWTQGNWRINNPKLQDLTPIRRVSSGNMFVPIKEPPAQEGKLKRTINKIYTNIPTKIARRNNHNSGNNLAKTDQINTEQSDEEMEILTRQEDEFSNCWPRDWLPRDCPDLRVLAINYSTDKLWRPLWEKMKTRSNLIERSQEMMEELLRLGVGRRPIIWVGHSKGGLYIKQILLNSSHAINIGNQTVGNLFEQTKAIMFYSVPHKGSPVADLTFPFFRRSIEVLEVQTNCEFVLDLHKRFLELFKNENSPKPEIFSFIDTENTPIGLFTSLKFIAYESADPDIGVKCDVPLDHRQICKPAGRDCFLYLELVKLINKTIFDKETHG